MSGRRRPSIARLQIARKELGIEEGAYRDVLARVTGKSSSSLCTDAQIGAVLDEFRRLGWKPRGARPLSPRSDVRMIYGVWKDVRALLDGAPGETELRGFVRRQTGKEAPEFLDHAEAVAVIEGLKGWRARLRRTAGEVA